MYHKFIKRRVKYDSAIFKPLKKEKYDIYVSKHIYMYQLSGSVSRKNHGNAVVDSVLANLILKTNTHNRCFALVKYLLDCNLYLDFHTKGKDKI